MQWTNLRLPALLAAAALALAGCGSDEGTVGAKKGGTPTDRAFVAAMVPHHRSAVEMARIAQKRGKSQFVTELAAKIIRTQNAETATLRRDGDTNETNQTGKDDDPEMLRDARPFDRAFIDMMIPHHQGAIRMARVEMDKGADPEIKTLAGQIIDAQTREINERNAHRKEAFGATSPTGGVPAGGGEHGAMHSG